MDNRQSDLCAQWKAADAAKESSDWAARSFWVTLIGTVALIYTIYLNIRATNAATSAAKAADQTLHGQRAWLTYEGTKIDRFSGQYRLKTIGSGLLLTVRFKNHGHTIATRCEVRLEHILQPAHLDKPVFDLSTFGNSEVGSVTGVGFEINAMPFALDDQELIEYCSGQKRLFVCAGVAYHTVFDSKESPRRLTYVAFELLHAQDNTPIQGTPFATMSRFMAGQNMAT